MPPVTETLAPAWAIFDLAATFVFALTGALTAAAKRQTLVTFGFFAFVTGVGGGTARDVLIGAPVFWVSRDATLAVCLLAALSVWLGPRHWWRSATLDWLDAVGLAAYATFGAVKALAFGVAPIPAVAMGVLTGCLGGIVRDVLAGQPSILMRPELYVTAAALAAASVVGLILIGVPPAVAGVVAASAGFTLRALAIGRGLRLPAYERHGSAQDVVAADDHDERGQRHHERDPAQLL